MSEENGSSSTSADVVAAAPVEETPEAVEVLGTRLDDYPLREAGEDPRWAVNTVKGWVWFDLICLVFVVTMLVLGLFYD